MAPLDQHISLFLLVGGDDLVRIIQDEVYILILGQRGGYFIIVYYATHLWYSMIWAFMAYQYVTSYPHGSWYVIVHTSILCHAWHSKDDWIDKGCAEQLDPTMTWPGG